jgi:hypothetical protein
LGNIHGGWAGDCQLWSATASLPREPPGLLLFVFDFGLSTRGRAAGHSFRIVAPANRTVCEHGR